MVLTLSRACFVSAEKSGLRFSGQRILSPLRRQIEHFPGLDRRWIDVRSSRPTCGPDCFAFAGIRDRDAVDLNLFSMGQSGDGQNRSCRRAGSNHLPIHIIQCRLVVGIGEIDIHPNDVLKIHPGGAQHGLHLVHGFGGLAGKVFGGAALARNIKRAIRQKAGAISCICTRRLNDLEATGLGRERHSGGQSKQVNQETRKSTGHWSSCGSSYRYGIKPCARVEILYTDVVAVM